MMDVHATGRPKIASLDGMRGLAVLLVLLVHYSVAWTLLFPQAANEATFTRLMADVAFSLGNAGVDLFMVMSGYLIYDHLMIRPQPFPVYFGRRVRRIFPTYLVVLAIYVVLMLIQPEKSKLPHDPIEAIIYIIQCALLIPIFFGKEPIVGIAWSLTYEILFYLALPLLIYVTGMRYRNWSTRIAILASIAVLISCITYAAEAHERIIMFVGGMLARESLVRRSYRFSRPRLMEGAALLIFVISIGFIAYWRGPSSFVYPEYPEALGRSYLLFIGFSTLLLATLGTDGICRRIFEWVPLGLIGEISFSFYLTHNLTMRIVIGFLLPHVSSSIAEMFFWLALPFTFVLCLIPGLAIYMLVELPLSLQRPTMISFKKQKKAEGDNIPAVSNP